MCSFAASSISYESYLSDMISSMTSLSYNSNNDEDNNALDSNVKSFHSHNSNNDNNNDNDYDDYDDNEIQNISNPSSLQKSSTKLTSFSISDGELLCIMSFDGIQFTHSSFNSSISTNTVFGTISNNNNFTIFINFMTNNKNKSSYSFIKIKLIQKEFHFNGTRLNDKIIIEKIINVKYLIHIKQLINIVNNVTTTFSCPAFNVSYYLSSF